MKKLWKVDFSESFSNDSIWCEEETIEDVLEVANRVKGTRKIVKIELISAKGIQR